MRTAKLSEVAEINPRKPRSVKERTDPVAFLGMADVGEDGTFSVSEQRAVPDVIKGYTYFERGDVLLAKITPCLENGKATFLESLPTDIGFGSTEFHVVRAGPEADARYLFYLLWNPAFRHVAERNMTGTAGQQRVPTHFLERVPVPLPPLDEQRRIAAILDKANGIRRKRREAIATTEELLRSTFLEMFGDPVMNPKGWPTVQVGEVVRESQYGTSTKANEDGRGLPILRMNNVTADGRVDLSEIKWVELEAKEVPKRTVQRGDLMFNRTNSPELVGKTAVWHSDESYALAGYLVRIRFKLDKADPDYVSGFLNSSYGKQYLFVKAKPSNNMSNFSASEFKRIPIPLPPIDRQLLFGRFAQRVRFHRANLERAVAEDDRLFSALLQKLIRATARDSDRG